MVRSTAELHNFPFECSNAPVVAVGWEQVHELHANLVQVPGDDAPVVWGVCGHAFHLQCINKCLATQDEQRCPFCRRAWEFKVGLVMEVSLRRPWPSCPALDALCCVKHTTSNGYCLQVAETVADAAGGSGGGGEQSMDTEAPAS